MAEEIEDQAADQQPDQPPEAEADKAPVPTLRAGKRYEGLILMLKDGHKLHVHPNHVDEHASLGWKKPEA